MANLQDDATKLLEAATWLEQALRASRFDGAYEAAQAVSRLSGKLLQRLQTVHELTQQGYAVAEVDRASKRTS